MRCWFSMSLIMVVFLSGCGSTVDTGPAPVGGYNTTKVTYGKDPFEHVPKTKIEVGELVVTEGANPLRLEKVISARNTEVFTFRGQVQGHPEFVRNRMVNVRCTRETPFGTQVTSGRSGRFEQQGDLAVFAITLPGPQEAGRHRLTIEIQQVFHDDGSFASQKEVDAMLPVVLVEGEIDVRAEVEKPVPIPDPLPSK